jgi:RNA polymerase sigma factor (sigma-70 family)
MDQQEFKQAVLPLGPRMLRLAVRLTNNNSEGRDCIQDVFLKLWLMKEKLKEYRSIEALAMTMVRNNAIDKIRHRNSISFSPLSAQHMDFHDNSAHAGIEERESVSAVIRILDSLPEQQKLAVQLRDIEGLETDEIIGIMGISENLFRVTLSRGRKAIREQLVNDESHGYKEHKATS